MITLVGSAMTREGGVLLLERRVIMTRTMVMIGFTSSMDNMIMNPFVLLVLPLF